MTRPRPGRPGLPDGLSVHIPDLNARKRARRHIAALRDLLPPGVVLLVDSTGARTHDVRLPSEPGAEVGP